MDIRLNLMAGIDVPIPECQLVLHQPTITEIAWLGEEKFFQGVQCLTISKNKVIQDKTQQSDLTNFQIFMMIMSSPETAQKKSSVLALLALLFPNYSVLVRQDLLCLAPKEGDIVLINESNFEALQSTLRQVFCSKPDSGPEFNPVNKKAQEIAEKIKKNRSRIAKIKGEDDISIFTQYLSILTVGLNSMSLNDCLSLTMFQMFDLVERYGLYNQHKMQIDAMMAGAKPDEEIVNWMKNLHKNL